MGVIVVTGGSAMCPMGTTPAQLVATSQAAVLADGKPVMTIKDTAAMVNISGCGMCTSLANPTVAAATAAALGVLTPQPCVPAPVGTWISAKTPIVANTPCLGNDGKIVCAYGGNISVTMPGQTKVVY